MTQKCNKKRTFITKKEADFRISEIKKINKKRHYKKREPVRSYQCDLCGQFHLTSLTSKEWESGDPDKPKESEERINEWLKGKLVFTEQKENGN